MNSTGPPPDALPRRPRWAFVLLLYPFVFVWLLASGQAVAQWLGLFSLAVLMLMPGLRLGRVLAWIAVTGIAVIAGYATAAGHRALVNYLPQIMIGLFLLVIFGRTLRPGSVPLITRIAAAMRKGQAPVPMRYTRGVTILWATLFALMVLEGLLLALFAPNISFGLVSALSYTVITVVMMAEYLFHTWRYPNPAQRGFPDFVRQLLQIDYRHLMND